MADCLLFRTDFSIDQVELDLFASHVSPERRLRSKRFRRREDRIRSILGEVLVRCALADRGIPMDAEFRLGTGGKPEIPGASSPRFNISHSGNWICCAVDDDPVGIDVEKISGADIIEISRLFHPGEAEYVRSGPPEASRERFFRIWTLKESYLKAIGTGLSTSLESFRVHPDEEGSAFVTIDGVREEGLSLHSEALDERHLCSVCCRSALGPENFLRIGKEGLLSRLSAAE